MNRNSKTLKDFTNYCLEHPQERFWQALRNWSGWPFILASTWKPGLDKTKKDEIEDTFYWE